MHLRFTICSVRHLVNTHTPAVMQGTFRVIYLLHKMLHSGRCQVTFCCSKQLNRTFLLSRVTWTLLLLCITQSLNITEKESKVTWICTVLCHVVGYTLKAFRCSTCNKGITQFYPPPTHEPYPPLLPSHKSSQPFGWYSLHLPTKGWPGWVGMCGWLHTEINVPQWEGHGHPSQN